MGNRESHFNRAGCTDAVVTLLVLIPTALITITIVVVLRWMGVAV